MEAMLDLYSLQIRLRKREESKTVATRFSTALADIGGVKNTILISHAPSLFNGGFIMFKRLKEKIEEEGNADFSPLKAPPGIVIRSQQEGPEPVKTNEESFKSSEGENDPAQLNETAPVAVEKSLVESDDKTEESDDKMEEGGTKPSSKKNDVRNKN